MRVVLSAHNIRKRFGQIEAIRDISFDVQDGEFLTFLGPSGCGKTTMLRMIAGFETPSSGQLMIDGQDISRVVPHERPVGMVFQSLALFPHLTVFENVAFGMRVKRIPEPQIRKRVNEVLELVELGEYGPRAVHQMSGGQRQRIALARSLVLQPRILLLDEPLGALDAKLRRQLQLDLRALQRRTGTTFIFVTHDQDEAMSMSDRIAVFNKGFIEQIDSPAEVYARPRTRFVADFVGASNVLAARGQGGTLSVPELGLSLTGPAAEAAAATQWISVRPEDMAVSPAFGPGQAGTARVEALEFTGMYARLHLELPGTGRKITAVQLPGHETGAGNFKPGDQVNLSIRAFVPVAD